MCTNIILYAYPEGEGDIDIKLWADDGNLYLEIKDHGVPFNPLAMKLPEIEDLVSREQKGSRYPSGPQIDGQRLLPPGKRPERFIDGQKDEKTKALEVGRGSFPPRSSRSDC